MKMLLAAALLLSFNVMANDEVDPASLDRFTCKLKVDKEKKMGVVFEGLRLDDESDILNVTSFKEVNFAGHNFKITGGIAPDDECATGKRCRAVLAMKVDNGPLSAAYANDSTKIGVLTPVAKLSCTLSNVRAEEDSLEE